MQGGGQSVKSAFSAVERPKSRTAYQTFFDSGWKVSLSLTHTHSRSLSHTHSLSLYLALSLSLECVLGGGTSQVADGLPDLLRQRLEGPRNLNPETRSLPLTLDPQPSTLDPQPSIWS